MTTTVVGPAEIALRTGSRTPPAYNAVFSVAGTLTSGGKPVGGARMRLQSSADGVTFKYMAKETLTAVDGSFELRLVPRVRTYYRRLKRSGAVRICLWQRVSGTWVGHGHTTARLTDHGSASICRAVVNPSEPGKWRLRAHHSSRDHAPHWSAHYTYLTVD